MTNLRNEHDASEYGMTLGIHPDAIEIGQIYFDHHSETNDKFDQYPAVGEV